MTYSGTLRTVAFADLLQWLEKGQKTGCLTVSDDLHNKHIYFRDGAIIYATSVRDEERFGGFLVRTSVISNDQLVKALELHEKTGKLIGETLVDLGFLADEQLAVQLKNLVEQIIYDVFTWREGSFEFIAEKEPPIEANFQILNVSEIVHEGAKKIEEWTQIRKVIPSMKTVLQIKTDEESDNKNITLSAIEFQLLALCDGIRSISDICEASTVSDFETCRLLAGMVSTGFLEVKDAESVPSDDDDTFDKLTRLIEFYQIPQRFIVEKLEMESGPMTRLRIDEIYQRAAVQYSDLLDGTELQEDGTFNTSVLLNHLAQIPKSKQVDQVQKAFAQILSEEMEYVKAELGRWNRKSLIKTIRSELKATLKDDVDNIEILEEYKVQSEIEKVIR